MILVQLYLFFNLLITTLTGVAPSMARDHIDPDYNIPEPLAGVLSQYPLPVSPQDDPDEPALRPYFTSGHLKSSKALVFIGGLDTGIGSVPYIPPLSDALGKHGWRVIQMSWTGEWAGFGVGSLDEDVAEMSELIRHIRKTDGVKDVVIMGHSTGSQDVIHYLTSPGYDKREPVLGGIMQGAASDRQWFTNPKNKDSKPWMDALPEAEKLVKAGQGEDFMDDDFCEEIDMLITAYRTFSLVGVGGDDDYFSSDLPDSDTPPTPHVHPLNKSFGTLPKPALALWSEKDEYRFLDDQRPLLQRWEAAAKGKLHTVIIKNADHSVVDEKPQKDLCEAVVDWLKNVIKA